MKQSRKRENFIDRTARRPSGEKAVRNYNEPRAHYKSFRIILEKLILKPEDRYVEIGCGGGVLLRAALGTAGSGAAIDHSPDMVELAVRNNAVDVKAGRLEIVHGDAASLPWPDSSFTAAASANMFFFVKEPEKMLREVFRVLNPGGRFSMVTMGKGALGRITFEWIYNLRTYSDEEMRRMLRDAGFSTIEVKTRFLFPFQICYAVKI